MSEESQKPQKPEVVMGRPRLPLSKDIFDGLCAQQATLEDVAAIFCCSVDTVERRCKEWYEGRTFADVSRELRRVGIVSLRQKGFKMAETNPQIHKFYMTNYSEMKDERTLRFGLLEADPAKLTTEQLKRIRNGEDPERVLREARNG